LFAFNEERFDRQPQQTQKTCDFFLLKKKKEKQRQKRARMFTIAPARVVPSKPGINARSRSRKIASRRECVLSEKKRPFVSRESIELRAIVNSDDDAPLQKEEENRKNQLEQKCVEDPSMTKALVNLYIAITFVGMCTFGSSFVGILDDRNGGKEVSLAHIVGVFLGVFLTNTSSKRAGKTQKRKVAMKGLCPACEEEVYTFFDNEGEKDGESNDSSGERRGGRGSIVEHECHCCGAQLVFASNNNNRGEKEGRIILVAKGDANE
jgi:hypothetical protein